ncbi:hypothetical protein [Dactylosporangium maewongense]|uniref:hypothetical protein n=1 Tax=Dactylosporangium maewongense TaxID=634393 RepID=UPI0031D04DE4
MIRQTRRGRTAAGRQRRQDLVEQFAATPTTAAADQAGTRGDPLSAGVVHRVVDRLVVRLITPHRADPYNHA